MSERWTFHAEEVTKSYDKGKTRANDDDHDHGGARRGLWPARSQRRREVHTGQAGHRSAQADFGFDHVRARSTWSPIPDAARQLCSYLPQAPVPIESFKLREAVHLGGLIRGGPDEAVRRRGEQLIEGLQLGEWRDTVGAKLSGGVRRLVGFVMVTVWPGRVVILDEPTNDVDPLRRRLLWEQVRRLGDEGAAVFLVTHNVMEAEKSVDRLAVINEGRLVAEGTPSSLKAGDRGRLRLQVMMVPGEEDPDFPSLVHHHARVGNNLVTVIDEAAASDGIAWAQQLMARGVAEEYALGATTLEDIYIRLTGHTSTHIEEAAA